MPRLMITCPATREPVFVGLSLDREDFEEGCWRRIGEAKVTCDCGQVHFYETKDIFLEGDSSKDPPPPRDYKLELVVRQSTFGLMTREELQDVVLAFEVNIRRIYALEGRKGRKEDRARFACSVVKGV